MRFYIKAELPLFNSEAFLDEMRKTIEAESKLAARAFASAALRRIPVRTGFVSGAFGTLTDMVGSVARLNPIVSFIRNVLHKAGYKRNLVTGEYYRGLGSKILKTPDSGRQFATPTGQIFQWSGFTYIFTYEVDITYFRINDNVGGHAPTAPWEAFAAGEEAYLAYIEKNVINKLSKVENYITYLQKSWN